jgi:hypothetical protein
LLVDDFQNNWTGRIYQADIKSITNLQTYNIDWEKVLSNEEESIKYEIDIDWDWETDQESYFKAVPKSLNEVWSISWYVTWDIKAKMAWWKVFIDENWDWELQENVEKFVITDNNWYYEFENLEKWKYSIKSKTKVKK